MTTYLLIDGENFLHKIEDALIEQGVAKKKININNIKLSLLLKQLLKGYSISEKFYYSAKLREFKETQDKSRELIHKQRVFKQTLEKQGFKFVLAGNVRPQKVRKNGKDAYIFREKGVDVRIAVDLVSLSCDKIISTAILCSSDSDLQPAIAEAKRRGVKIVYLGFEMMPNKGLIYTCDKTILLRNSEILKYCPANK